jgi:uncharacterized membrane protein YagU involved in acid resistance
MLAAEVIVLSGCLAGVLDISATGTLRATQGIPIERALQFVASGALGASAFDGGKRTAFIGLAFHFLIAFVAAAFYFELSNALPTILNRPVLFGALYGAIVHLVMTFLVVPLSRTAKRKFSLAFFLTQLAIHIFCVGLPIALLQSYLLR